jgi:dTDP-4-dehydrorhamnose reductase
VITRLHDPIPLPLLITGVAGVAGYNAFDYVRARYPGQVIAIRQEDNWRLGGEGVVACDAENHRRLRALFDEYQFRSVLNCAGNCALRACELDTRLAWRTNVEGLVNLLSIVVERDVRLVHLSIDLVYSGERAQRAGSSPTPILPTPIAPVPLIRGNVTSSSDFIPPLGLEDEPVHMARDGYIESDPTDPVTVYGKTMVAAEQLLHDWMPEACILRISLPMGVSFNGHAGAIDWIQSRFKHGRPATLYFDEVRTPAYTDCLNRLYERVLASDVTGLYHAGGPRARSLYEIAQIVNRVGGYDPMLLNGCPRIEAGPIPPRAGDVTMNSTALADVLGGEPLDTWPFDPAFVPTHRNWHHERDGAPGSRELLARVLYRNPRRQSNGVFAAND